MTRAVVDSEDDIVTGYCALCGAYVTEDDRGRDMLDRWGDVQWCCMRCRPVEVD